MFQGGVRKDYVLTCSNPFLGRDGVKNGRELQMALRRELLVCKEEDVAMGMKKLLQKDRMETVLRRAGDMSNEGGQGTVDNETMMKFVISRYVVREVVPKMKVYVEERNFI